MRRLLRDFKEILQNPTCNASVEPLESDLFVWHGNVTTSDGPLAGVPIHFVILFSDRYPCAAPQVRA